MIGTYWVNPDTRISLLRTGVFIPPATNPRAMALTMIEKGGILGFIYINPFNLSSNN